MTNGAYARPSCLRTGKCRGGGNSALQTVVIFFSQFFPARILSDVKSDRQLILV